MEFSRKKEVRTIIVSGLISFALYAVGIGLYFLDLWGEPCIPMGIVLMVDLLMVDLRETVGWFYVSIPVVLIISGYGAFVGWIGFRDFSSTKKVSGRVAILAVIGLLGLCAFFLPFCLY